MHAARLHAFGAADNLRYEKLPDPTSGADAVRISVHAGVVDQVAMSCSAGRRVSPPRSPRGVA